VLWVDAICINQIDSTEKGHEDELMGRVYQDSSRVCVSLGDAADESDQAMQLINDHAQLWLMMPPVPSLINEEDFIPQRRALTFLVLRRGLLVCGLDKKLRLLQQILLCAEQRPQTRRLSLLALVFSFMSDLLGIALLGSLS
jgi:hypothetical protein